MKELWIEIDKSLPEDARNGLLKSVVQNVDTVVVGAKDVENAKKTSAKVASTDEGDIVLLEAFDENRLKNLKMTGRAVAVKFAISGRDDQETATKAAELASDYIIIRCKDWKVIPLENLIARTRGRSKLLAEVSSAEEAKLALKILELGADGVVLKTSDPGEITRVASLVKEKAPEIDLVTAKVVELRQIGTGARVCIDTCDFMSPGEGILVGCQSSGLFLVQAEVQESPYVEPRPFRVNAGPVSLYTLSSPTQTRYLSELKAGEEILVVDREGKARSTNVARVKIEWRPMILFEAEHKGKRMKNIVQNAETIRLVTSEGSKSIVDLKEGDEVLAHIAEGGRHFGTLVKEEKVIER